MRVVCYSRTYVYLRRYSIVRTAKLSILANRESILLPCTTTHQFIIRQKSQMGAISAIWRIELYIEALNE